MCGLTGFMTPGNQFSSFEMEEFLISMSNTIIHRGPDNSGFWSNAKAGIWLGHRRLSILDLSYAGHQPMHSHNGRYIISYNGEIYNHLLLRKILQSSGHTFEWRGHSDTETLLAGFDLWGIQGTVEKAIGMFAFAVWDNHNKTLTLGRDRIGEKPLYYGWQGQGNDAVFLFGSELKSLRAHPSFENKISREAISLQMRHNYIPAPYSIYEGVSKLLPGTLLTVSLQDRSPKLSTFWSGAEVARSGVASTFAGNYEQAINELETLLKDAISKQMLADVPLGAFLSGGVDSSVIVSLMQAQSSRPIKTFTIGFNEDDYNEAAYAKTVAKHLGTDHTELYVTAKQARAVIPHLATLYDEPFSDSSQIPTYLLSQLARQQVKVSLSGDAGDELFCGYNRYQITKNIWQKLEKVPMPFRKLVGKSLIRISPQKWNILVKTLSRVIPQSYHFTNVGDKLHKGARVLASQSADDLYYRLISHWNNPESLVIDGYEPPTLLTKNIPILVELDNVQRMMALDMLSYLPDDILTKVDRAAMGNSLETRMPFLDYRVIDFAWSLPQSMKLRYGQTKWVLRQILYRHVPKALIERPKMGFGVPIDAWLRGPLRDWAESLLNSTRIKNEGFFNSSLILQKWTEHLNGKHNWQNHLWNVLMFQSWLEQNK